MLLLQRNAKEFQLTCVIYLFRDGVMRSFGAARSAEARGHASEWSSGTIVDSHMEVGE